MNSPSANLSPRTLRGKLALPYAALLLLGLVLFAGGTFATEHALRASTLDERIESKTRSLIAVTSSQAGVLTVVGTDRTRFDRIVGTLLGGAIVARNGRVVRATATVIPHRLLELAAHPPPATTLQTVALANDTLRVGLTPVPRLNEPLGVAIVWRSISGIADADRQLAITFALAIPLIAGFALIAGNIVAARGLAPLRALAALASEIEAHDLSRRLDLSGNAGDELGLLCATFNRMLSRLQASFERERRFASDASHELRAPLSVIRAEADLTLRQPRERAEYERALRAISTQAERLAALTRDMLAEARAESAARLGQPTEIDLEQVARDVADELAPLASGRGVALSLRGGESSVLTSTPSGLRRAVLCVVHNALKFARRSVEIEIHTTPNPARALVVVNDDGPGFSAAALEHATERFWRDRQVHSSPPTIDGAGSGTGLGLAIAASLLRSERGTLQLANRAGGGASVTLTFPTEGTANTEKAPPRAAGLGNYAEGTTSSGTR